jgi:hypothetical protein
MKPSKSNNHNDIQDRLELAFEEGYKLGRDDAKEGIFIDLDAIIDQFRFNMLADKVNT